MNRTSTGRFVIDSAPKQPESKTEAQTISLEGLDPFTVAIIEQEPLAPLPVVDSESKVTPTAPLTPPPKTAKNGIANIAVAAAGLAVGAFAAMRGK